MNQRRENVRWAEKVGKEVKCKWQIKNIPELASQRREAGVSHSQVLSSLVVTPHHHSTIFNLFWASNLGMILTVVFLPLRT